MSAARSARARLAAVALVGLLGRPAAAADEYDELRAVLHRRGDQDARTQAELSADLAALGSEAVAPLYALATGRGLDPFVGEEWVPAAWACTPEEISELARAALERAPVAAVVAHLARVLDGAPEPPERQIVLRVLGGQGSADGLALALRCANELGDLELLRPSVRRTLVDALASILRRDERAYDRLAAREPGDPGEPGQYGALERLPPETCAVLVQAIGAAGRSQGMELLERLLARGEPPKERVIEAMAELELARPWELSGRTLESCSAWWSSPESAERARVATLAGRLHALEAVPTLIGLAGERDALVQRCAVGALENMARLPLGADEAAWSAWHEREQRWHDSRWAPLCATLAAREPGPANDCLRELALHPLYRHAAAAAIAASLAEQPRVVALASCAELERLGSRWALPGLVSTLELPQPQLRAAAWRALRALTGEERELSVAVWRELVGE